MSRTVLLLHRGGDLARNTEICLIQSARAFAAQGLQVVVCRNNPVVDPQLAAIEPQAELLPMEFPELKLDGKNTTSPIGSYIRAAAQFNTLLKRPRPSFIYCRGGLPCQPAVPAARLRRIPVVCRFHHSAIKRDYFVWLVKWAGTVLFPSQYARRRSSKKAQIDGEVIYNGVDINHFHPPLQRDSAWRKRIGIAPEAIDIGQVAAREGNKRPELLIRVFASLLARCTAPLHLCLVGKGELEQPMRALVRALDLEARVTITGFVPDVLPYYQHVFDINALVSREEGLGIAAIEGSACGLPLVVTDCTGLAETVVHGETGFSFPTNDTIALEKQLVTLIEDNALRAQQEAAGCSFAPHIFFGPLQGRDHRCIALWTGCFVIAGLAEPLQWAIAFIVALSMSVVSYHWREKPAISYGARLAKQWA